MSSPLQSLIDCGTKLWLDSIDPDLITTNKKLGATGATSNPIIVADLIKTGRFDHLIKNFIHDGHDDETIAWKLTDTLVQDAEKVFHPVWQASKGNDGYVSFELDPLLEDVNDAPAHDERVKAYIESARKWKHGHDNRMIKIPATPAGLDAVEDIVADGTTVNVTLIFSSRQYQLARDAVWRGAQRRKSLDDFKSVYSIFISRIDVYTEKHASDLSADAQGIVGIVNAKRIWAENRKFWHAHKCPLDQEIVFASTGTKKPDDPPHKYVKAFAGSDIETNPPNTNDAVDKSGLVFHREIEQLPAQAILDEIDAKVDFTHLEETLMEEGLRKFAEPQKSLIALLAEKRAGLA